MVANVALNTQLPFSISSLYKINPAQFESRSWRDVPIQHYVILYYKLLSDLRQVSGFLQVLRFSPSIKLTATIKLKYC